ncbi:MAG: hypothetical protein KDC95_21610 [Planctomycetes bacterium]|nr:hypothetical protein [Planctomycetota bacterium]
MTTIAKVAPSLAMIGLTSMIAIGGGCHSTDPTGRSEPRVHVQPRVVPSSRTPMRPKPPLSFLSEAYASMRADGFQMLRAQWCLPEASVRFGAGKYFGRCEQPPVEVELPNSISPVGHYVWRAPCLYLWREHIPPLVGSPFAPTTDDHDEALAMQRAMTAGMIGPPDAHHAVTTSPLAMGVLTVPVLVRARTELLFEFEEVRAPSACELVLDVNGVRDAAHAARVFETVVEIHGRKLDGDEILLWSHDQSSQGASRPGKDSRGDDTIPWSRRFECAKHVALTGLRIVLVTHDDGGHDGEPSGVFDVTTSRVIRSDVFDLDAIALVDARGDRHWSTAGHVCTPAPTFPSLKCP